jgi:hypothetical protein
MEDLKAVVFSQQLSWLRVVLNQNWIRHANQWMTDVNAGYTLWNGSEYGDAGLLKNKYQSEKFVFDSGIRLNLVPDYKCTYLSIPLMVGKLAKINTTKNSFCNYFISKILINLFNRMVLIEALILFHYVILDLQLISEYLNYRYI